MDKLKAFESFVSVALKGSLTAAAKAEGVAPAIVGRRLDSLEAHLGVKLLVRTTQRITLTHEGTVFLEDCQRLLADVANAEASVRAGGLKASGHLRITTPAGFGRRHVAPLPPQFHHLHPSGPMDCSDGQVLHDWCLAGHSIAWRSTWEVASKISSGQLVPVLEAFAVPPNGIYAVFSQRKNLPLRLRLWIDFLKDHYGQSTYWSAGA
ncbi:LysR family transcriptional regulator [Limnohabitans sp.]|uniref:LysR family transcriptional regulator n=1 Tax=Limnohabitans sp. TaxID=1907725 RepID=UPI00286F7F87|nr:LysR family transcriptional regulator [Limnohabitans sp.]